MNAHMLGKDGMSITFLARNSKECLGFGLFCIVCIQRVVKLICVVIMMPICFILLVLAPWGESWLLRQLVVWAVIDKRLEIDCRWYLFH